MTAYFMSIDWEYTTFEILGGLGIFLFGINMMSDSLKKLAGSKLKMILEKTTNTPLKGIFVGILITGIIQSSSATSALVVGLVRAGLMTLPQAVGVIFGANIGTTVTSVLIGLNIGHYALPIMFVGSVLIFFVHKRKIQELGKAILGFGMLFFGLETMGGALKQLVNEPAFSQMLLSVADHPILGVLVGVGTTAVIQSSSATIGILQQLYSTGGIPLIGAIAIVLGDNIGTTVTSVFASIGGSSAAKRTAGIHVMFNTIGTIVFFILLRPYTELIGFLAEYIFGSDYLTNKLTISLAHVLFNIINVAIMYWFIKQLVWLISKIIPSRNEIEVDDIVLEEKLIKESPDLALENARKAIINMGNVTRAMFEYAYNFSFANDHRDYEMGAQCEELLDTMDDKIHNYLVKIGANDLANRQIQQLAKDIDTITDLERIGDHLNNIIGFFQERYDIKIALHEEARADLLNLYDFLRKTLKDSLLAYVNKDKILANEVNIREDTLDKMVKMYRKKHINRINDRTCSETEAGFYVDILSNMERIGDHCNNMVINILSDSFTHDEQFY
ncbi:MAG TPA: Na/Pi cotransporter family protein [Bacillota bacterium]|nr:Na/Pi cotransporter family protein [Bacillota bacterium]HRX91389.1 Na/Pi cotransporter family protein [Candidatus Izemoplasmatales bacterium]